MIAGAVEETLARLKEARPHLETRLDRAAGLLVMQLSSRPRSRPIKCRIRRGGKRVLLVASLTSGGITYEVDPQAWSCSCPDFHRRGSACKHVLAAWTLERANTPLPKAPPAEIACEGCGEVLPRALLVEVGEGQAEETLNPGMRVCRLCARDHGLPVPNAEKKGCDACRDGWVFKSEEVIDPETGEARTYQDPVRCLRCADVRFPYMTADELEEWMENARWRYARSMPKHPHDYSLKEWNGEETFLRVVRTIWDFGYDRPYLRRLWRSLDIGDRHYVWVCTPPERGSPAPLDATELVNRAVTRQTELLERGRV